MDTSVELKNQIKETYRFRTELHAHTAPISRCSQIEPEEMAQIYSEKGYDAVVITNHFTYDEVKILNYPKKEEYVKRYVENFEETKRYGEKYGVRFFLGVELRFTENSNDYLIYGVNEDILFKCYDYLEKGIEVFRKEVKLPDSVFIHAHPFRKDMTLVDSSLLDGIETFNMHPGHNSAVGICNRYAYEQNIRVKTAGSDFHHKNLGHEAVSALRTKIMPNDSFDIAKILKSGDYVFEIGENSIVIP